MLLAQLYGLIVMIGHHLHTGIMIPSTEDMDAVTMTVMITAAYKL